MEKIKKSCFESSSYTSSISELQDFVIKNSMLPPQLEQKTERVTIKTKKNVSVHFLVSFECKAYFKYMKVPCQNEAN